MSVTVRSLASRIWCSVAVAVVTAAMVAALDRPNVCMVQQKYNITKRIKYRAPMSVRTYEWCFAMPPRCSRWTTEMRDLTRLETEERTAEVAVCCPGFKMTEVACVPICPYGKTGPGCLDDCPPKKWGPNCANDCRNCSEHGSCSPTTGECRCQGGWQGESCDTIVTTTTSTTTTTTKDLLTTIKSTTNPPTTKKLIVSTTLPNIPIIKSTETTHTTPETTTSKKLHSTVKMTSLKPETTTVQSNMETKKIKVPTKTDLTKNELTKMFNNETSTTEVVTMQTFVPTTQETDKYYVINPIYNRTEATIDSSTNSTIFFYKMTTPRIIKNFSIDRAEQGLNTSSFLSTTNPPTTLKTTKSEAKLSKSDVTLKVYPTTVKFKPKEIWIKPAHKGESTITEFKTKTSHDLPTIIHRIATKKEIASALTTPRTIIVSIIPTSYATFKKIALTTALYSMKSKVNLMNVTSDKEFTESMTIHTTTVAPQATNTLKTSLNSHTKFSTSLLALNKSVTEYPVKETPSNSTLATPVRIITNSMGSQNKPITKVNIANSITTTSSTTNLIQTTKKQNVLFKILTSTETTVPTPPVLKITKSQATKENVTENSSNQKHSSKESKTSIHTVTDNKITETPVNVTNVLTKQTNRNRYNKSNLTIESNTKINIVEETTETEETFHILTEPEHITAVMGDKGTVGSAIDLVSVISIATGVMMTIITVAVVIVMIERCRRPRYQHVGKNDIHMQVMIDNNDVPPPPYVRSIFHTPLPDPPTSEKCHYQPISTLDRNLKQFMRPVVVQTISPVMLENFRDIIECHYDHLPRRPHFDTLPPRCSITPSIAATEELRHKRPSSVTDSSLEALKCEARLDVIDSTTSEPLYAEIPCWRPPSEHAIEVLTINGEAVTEL